MAGKIFTIVPPVSIESQRRGRSGFAPVFPKPGSVDQLEIGTGPPRTFVDVLILIGKRPQVNPDLGNWSEFYDYNQLFSDSRRAIGFATGRLWDGIVTIILVDISSLVILPFDGGRFQCGS